jgi:hypothetical protein
MLVGRRLGSKCSFSTAVFPESTSCVCGCAGIVRNAACSGESNVGRASGRSVECSCSAPGCSTRGSVSGLRGWIRCRHAGSAPLSRTPLERKSSGFPLDPPAPGVLGCATADVEGVDDTTEPPLGGIRSCLVHSHESHLHEHVVPLSRRNGRQSQVWHTCIAVQGLAASSAHALVITTTSRTPTLTNVTGYADGSTTNAEPQRYHAQTTNANTAVTIKRQACLK